MSTNLKNQKMFMAKERYKIRLFDNDPMYFDLYDNLKKKYFESPNDIVKVLNQQDARIKELEEQLSTATMFHGCDTLVNQLKQENQQLKEQLLDEKMAHDLCIDTFNEECEKLRKQIKFESEAIERFKQSQNQKAIELLEKLRDYFAIKDTNLNAYDIVADYGDILDWISDKIEELKG